ncbi:MAG: bifunctional precorrin-2 dehydrogenase/sirohydrochlorin ferrochelatase [candidate division NC10 bacterium]|nr:bifunctional precorrin-2 dehydrogenase/sirohydrochlorin ferrochelatase [candidate division NC10 bacterium]
MPRYYPMMVDLAGRKCLVAGGGAVAERKASILLSFGADVVVVSPELSPGLKKLADEGKLKHLPRGYRREDLEGTFLAIGATDDREINGQLARDARAEGVWANVVDSPQDCNFIVPSIVTRGDLLIAISTGGKSPALAKKIRQEMEEIYGEEYAELLEILGELRAQVLREVQDPVLRQGILEGAVNSNLLERIRAGEGPLIRKDLRRLWKKALESHLKRSGGRKGSCP